MRRENDQVKRAFGSVITVLGLLVAGGVTSGCEDRATVAADCTRQIRVGDHVFTSNGYTQRGATRHGAADQAECHDVGVDAPGSVFPADPQQVRTWTFDGYSPDKVLGVRFGEDGFAVFVADSVRDHERNRIFEALSQPAR